MGKKIGDVSVSGKTYCVSSLALKSNKACLVVLLIADIIFAPCVEDGLTARVHTVKKMRQLPA